MSLTAHKQRPAPVCLTAGCLGRALVWSVPGMSHPMAGQEIPPFPLHTPLPCTGPTSPLPKPRVPSVLRGQGLPVQRARGERDKVREGGERGEQHYYLATLPLSSPVPPCLLLLLSHSSSPGVQLGGEGSATHLQGCIGRSRAHGCMWFPHEIQCQSLIGLHNTAHPARVTWTGG